MSTTSAQGYVATLTRKGRRKFLRFAGGLTKDFDDALVFETPAAAIASARRIGEDIYDVPGYAVIGPDAKEVKEG